MVDFKKGIYTKNFVFTDTDGVEQTIVLKPLSAKYLPALFESVKGIQKGFKEGMDDSQALEGFTKELVEDLKDMCIETIKKSYPQLSEDDVEGFVVSHFMVLFPVIIELNMGTSVKKK